MLLLALLEGEADRALFWELHRRYERKLYKVALIRAMPEQYREVLELKFVLEWSNIWLAMKKLAVFISKSGFLFLTFAFISLMCVSCSETEPNNVYLYVECSTVQIQNANGKCVELVDGYVEGEMEVLDIIDQSEYGCMVVVPYSDSFTFVGAEVEKGKYSIRTNLDCAAGVEYTVSGNGISTVTISPSGKILLDGRNLSFEVFASMRSRALGDHGNVRLSGIAEDSAEIYFNEEKDTISFDGVIPGFMLMSISGNTKANSIMIPNSGSGTIGLAGLTDGMITVIEESGNLQTLSIETYIG